MLSAISAWLTKEGIGLLLGALGKLALDAMSEYRAGKALREAGALQTANKVNVETMETQDAMDAVARPSDDAVADSLRTAKF